MADSLESKEDIDDICEQMQKFIFAWRQLPQRPKVLIIDELAMMKTKGNPPPACASECKRDALDCRIEFARVVTFSC